MSSDTETTRHYRMLSQEGFGRAVLYLTSEDGKKFWDRKYKNLWDARKTLERVADVHPVSEVAFRKLENICGRKVRTTNGRHDPERKRVRRDDLNVLSEQMQILADRIHLLEESFASKKDDLSAAEIALHERWDGLHSRLEAIEDALTKDGCHVSGNNNGHS